MASDRARALRQLTVSYIVTNALVFALSRSWATAVGLHELIGALFLAAALVSVRVDDDDTRRYGLRLGGVFPGRQGDDRSLPRTVIESLPAAARELCVAALVAAVVLPVYAFFWPMFNRPGGASSSVLYQHPWREVLTNLFAVALTEEMYFRGYVQTRLADVFGAPEPRRGVRALRAAALPVVVGSVLFALTHLTVRANVPRAVVFFPGLLFGALRVVRGGVGAAVFLHAGCNLFELWLEAR